MALEGFCRNGLTFNVLNPFATDWKNPRKPAGFTAILAITALLTGFGAGQPDWKSKPAAKPEITQNDVIPIVLLRCTVCHGGRTQEGEVDLRNRSSMLRGGKSGP